MADSAHPTDAAAEDKCCLCLPIVCGMKTLTILMILGNASAIIQILSGLGSANAIAIILGLGNVVLSGGVIYLLAGWLCDAGDDEKRKNLVKGLLINVAQTCLQALVLAVFASQYQQTIIDAATEAAQASCDAAGVDCTE